LGSVFTIITQKLSFRQKTNSLILLIFCSIGLLTYLYTTYNNYNFISYAYNKIIYILNYSFSGYNKLLAYADEMTLYNILSYLFALVLLIIVHTPFYMITRYIFEFIFFHKNYNILNKAFQTKFSYSLLNFIIWIINFGFFLSISFDCEIKYNIKMESFSSEPMKKLATEFLIKILLLNTISALIYIIGCKYIADSLEEESIISDKK